MTPTTPVLKEALFPGHGAFFSSNAVISDDGLYRYELIREWEQYGSRMVFVMLNPSTADASIDDPTIRRCMAFARREGCGGIKVYNLFALRVTRPVHLFDKTIADDPNGVANYGYVSDALNVAGEWKDKIVVAWGAFPKAGKSDVYNLLASQRDVRCLGKTADGSPRHPLYVRGDQPLEVWP